VLSLTPEATKELAFDGKKFIRESRQLQTATLALRSFKYDLHAFQLTEKFIRLITPKHCVRCFESRVKMLLLPWEVKPARVF
jgi:hypothetical protein